MRLIVGLRNPGREYERTRHNLGFTVLEKVLERAGAGLSRGPRNVRGLVGTIGEGVLALAPTSYMNQSGAAVRAALDYWRIDMGEMLVIHDDIDLPFGRLRLQVGGGSGGHNGVRSLESSLGTTRFSRLKVGVGRPPGDIDPADFVLRRFTKSEAPQVETLVADAADVVERWLEDPVRAQEMAALRGRDG